MAETKYPMVYYQEKNKNKTKEFFSWVYKICPEEPFRVFNPGKKTTYLFGKTKKEHHIEILNYFKTEEEAQGKKSFFRFLIDFNFNQHW